MPRDKLIKWYGWIFILFLCFTPLVFVLLPVLMLNVNYFNKKLKESRIKEEMLVEGVLSKCIWSTANDNGLNFIKGELVILVAGKEINCSYLKYTRKGEVAPEIGTGINVIMTGSFGNDGIFKIRTIREDISLLVYTTEPSISVY